MNKFCPDFKKNTCDCFLNFNSWIESGKEWYWIVDNLGKFVWSSHQCEQIIGYTKAEMIGKRVFNFIPERDRERVIGFLEAKSTNFAEYSDFEIIYTKKDKTETYVSVSGSPVFNDDGSYFGYRGITRDITAEKQRQWDLLESRKLWKRAQKTMKIASWEENFVSGEVYYSSEMFKMFELEMSHSRQSRKDDFIGRIHPEDREGVIQSNRDILKKAMQKTIRFRLLFPGGRVKYLTENLESITNNFDDVIITTGVLQDITQMHRYHQELNRKIKFEHYTAKIAERFVMVQEHEKTIESVLAEIGELIDANRTYIFEFDFQKNVMSNTYEWCDQATDPVKEHLQKVPIEIARHWLEKFLLKKAVKIDDVDQIPDDRREERETLQAQMIKSLLAQPIFCNGELWGFFGADNINTEFKWDQETITVTKVFSQIMQNFLEKASADEKIKNAKKSLEVLVETRTHKLEKTLAKMKETQAHFNLALNASDIGLWTWDFENDAVPASFAFSKYFKHVEKGNCCMYNSELMRWQQSVHPDYTEYVFTEKAKYIEGLKKEYSIDYRIWFDGYNDWRWINSTGYIVSRDESGKPKVMVGTYKDITETKETERMLVNARKSAERQVKNKAEFLSNLNHELRTPLTIILGNTEILMYADIDKELKSFVKTTNRAAAQLLEIIEDIVVLSKIDEGSVNANIEVFDTEVFFKELCEYYHELANSAHLQFLYEIDSTTPSLFKTDSKLFKKICNNLVGNAVKFTKEGYITLKVGVENQYYVITIADTGIGISEEKLPIIFERFTQANSSSRRRYGGTGLGLAIVKSAVDILKGEITVESHEGEGSIFKVFLPQ